MSASEEIERKIRDFCELGLPSYIPRKGQIHLVENMVSTVMGARRSGKSYRVRQAADELITSGFISSINQICAIDFDNPILSTQQASNLSIIQETFLRINSDFDLKTPLLFIFDEIHKIENWEEYVIDLSRNPHWKVIVTGSSSKLLRDNIATELRGKAVSSVVYPLDFREYITFAGDGIKPGSTKGNAEIQRLFDLYLKWGGFPAIATMPEQSREAVLREYYDTMMLNDLIQRYNISNPRLCSEVCTYLLSNISSPYTQVSLMKYVAGCGYKTSKETIRDYLAWIEDAWMLFSVPIFSHSLKKQERNYKKIYAIDWALANSNSLVWDGFQSRAFENMVYLHLRQRGHRINYYLTRDGEEVDFIVSRSGKADMAVQVSYAVDNPQTLERELKALVKTASYLGTTENIIVTHHQEEVIESKGVKVNVVPAWKWLLN